MQTLSAEDPQVLSVQTIDAHGPGTVLRDFDTLLEVVGAQGIGVTSQNHLLPLSALAPLKVVMSM